MRRWISLILLAAVLLSLPLPAMAADREIRSGSVTNPLFVDVSIPEEQESSTPRGTRLLTKTVGAQANTLEATYVSVQEAADQLRLAMMNRTRSQAALNTLEAIAADTSNPTDSKKAQNLLNDVSEKNTIVSLYITVPNYWAQNDSANNWLYADFFPLSYSQDLAKGAYDGDYLQWTWNNLSWFLVSSSGDQYHFLIDIKHYTTASEEQLVKNRVSEVLSGLGVASKTPYDAYAAIYDYVVSTVTYDNGASYGLLTYTAYGAIKNHAAVCQGFAALYYALCRQAGLPARIMYTPLGFSPGHAWNIVKLGSKWYCVDSTWEVIDGSGRDFFLMGTDRFEQDRLHTRASELATASFNAAYPISKTDYDPGTGPEPEKPFYTDVPESRWSYEFIQDATKLGLFNGVGNGEFAPTMKMNRAMLVTVLWRLEGEPESPAAGYSDVPKSTYYTTAVGWASANGIVNGIGGNRFDPNGNATREQVVTILFRYINYLGKDTSARANLSKYTDASSVSNFAKTAMQWAVAAGIMNGTSSTTLSPQLPTTREQLAALLVRMIHTYGL